MSARQRAALAKKTALQRKAEGSVFAKSDTRLLPAETAGRRLTTDEEAMVQTLGDAAWEEQRAKDPGRARKAAHDRPLIPTRHDRMIDMLDRPYATADEEHPTERVPFSVDSEDGEAPIDTLIDWRPDWYAEMGAPDRLAGDAPPNWEAIARLHIGWRSLLDAGKLPVGGTKHCLILDLYDRILVGDERGKKLAEMASHVAIPMPRGKRSMVSARAAA